MTCNHINKIKKEFFHKCVSVGKSNTKHKYGKIVSTLVYLASQGKSLEESKEVSPDTLGRRTLVGNHVDAEWFETFNANALQLVRFITKANQRVNWKLLIDDSDDPFYGDVKKLLFELESNGLLNFLYEHKTEKGATGSFKYTMIALSSKAGTFPVFIMPKIRDVDQLPIVEEVLKVAKQQCRDLTVLADRWFGHGRFIDMLQRLNLPFCIRLKESGDLKDLKKSGRKFVWHSFTINKGGIEKEVNFRVYVHRPRSGGTFLLAASSKTGESYWARYLYKSRWGIENAFKQGDRIQLKTSSRNPMMRLFVFVFAQFLFLLYQLKRLLQKRWHRSIRETILGLFGVRIIILRDDPS
jgi:hypothetical protein